MEGTKYITWIGWTLPLIVVGFLAWVFVDAPYPTIDLSELQGLGAAVAMVPALLFGILAFASLSKHRESKVPMLVILPMAALGFGLCGAAAAPAINGALDSSQPVVREVLVLDVQEHKRTTRRSSRRVRFRRSSSSASQEPYGYTIYLESWRAGEKWISMPARAYLGQNAVPMKTKAQVTTRKGALGYEWITDWDLILPPPGTLRN